MEKYENIEVVGEGSYGIVMKCRHKETGQIVAIKKFLESVENANVRKLAFREIRMLKNLRHENLVSLIEVFRRKKRFYLVFEYLDHTILDELEAVGGGLGFELTRRHIFQVLRGLNFCHSNHIMHRDVKPENVLVSPYGVIKLCDFGFARLVTGPNESCTDYVATRWYRAPELLIGDSRYGRAVDTWAAGCLYAEMLSGEPLFPGDSDVDQLYRITRTLGGLCSKHQSIQMNRNGNGRVESRGLRTASVDSVSLRSGQLSSSAVRSSGLRALRALLPGCSSVGLDFLSQCLRMDPEARPSCANLLQHPLFMQDCFAEKFLAELREYVAKEAAENPLLQMKRDEERRLSVLSLEEPARIYSGATRWHMKLMRDPSMSEKFVDLSTAAAQLNAQRKCVNETNRPVGTAAPSHLQRPRDQCYVGPSAIAANTTSVKKLEQRCQLPSLEAVSGAESGASQPSGKTFTLPQLVSSSSSRESKPTKRTKLELPSQCA